MVTVLTAATLGGLLSARLKLPVILGYILGGMVVGPTGLGLIREIIQVETLAQLGAAFLLFALGVEFSLAELKKVQRIALGGGSLQILVTPFLIKAVPWILQLCQRVPLLARWLNQADFPQAMSKSNPLGGHVIVCGYGRVGQNIVSLLLARQYPVVVIEQSEAKVQLLRDKGIPYIYGNCASEYILEAARIRQARSLVLVVADPVSSKLCLQQALKLVPHLDVVARACKDSDIDLLYQLGAKEVVHPEFEASLELSTHLLLALGETPQMVEREVMTVRQSRYADFRPDIACPLPASSETQLELMMSRAE